MNPLLLKSLQLEYENTPITLTELCDKHKVTTADLKGFKTWEKLSRPKPPVIIDEQAGNAQPPAAIATEEDKDEVFKDILRTTALSVLDKVQDTLTDNYEMTPRDLKDISAALATLRETVVGKPQPQNINLTNINAAVVNYAQLQLRQVESDC